MSHSGLTVQNALARFLGNKAMYQKMLDCFLRDYQDFDVHVVRLLREGNHEDAGVKLHTMKGVAGSLGAEYLHEISQKAEALCKQKAGVEEIEPCLAEFSAELTLVFRQIREGVDLG